MKRILFVLLMASMFTMAHGIPALSVWRTYHQSDGSEVMLMLVGDENFHYFITTDHIAVMERGGSYYYADANGAMLTATNMLAHSPASRTTAETAAIARLGCTQSNLRRIRSNMPQVTQPRRVGDPMTGLTGSKRGLVILVSFDDLDFKSEDANALFTDMVNTEGYTNTYGAIGSVHDYFSAQSYGVFDLTFDVVGPYKTPKSVTYYGENDNGGDQRGRLIEFVKFACESADADVDFKDYDWDNDGEVEQVFILFAGKGEANGGESYTIWPHESHIGNIPTPYILDDVILDTYACSEELNSANQYSGIGTFCHEFSHCMGLPDLYDTAVNNGGASVNYGMGSWDVMCVGSYNNNGWIPASYTGYERHFCSWLEYKELVDPCKVKDLKPLADNGDVFVCYNPANQDEYYLFEHRNNSVGWDKGVAGKGLLIYHVNYIAGRWHNNTVNSSAYSEPCLTISPADNVSSEFTTSGDLYPNSSGGIANNRFADNTSPADILYTPNTDGTYLLHIKLSKIAYTNTSKTVSFTFNDGTDFYNGIDDLDISHGTAGLYTVDGMPLDVPATDTGILRQGLYIVRSADGSVRKVLVK
ncbi:MAG: M6 family metalloprotease domain-containing protein [Prevotella sp.]|nr:M6 family metalloprotease domain-containing protein [Prevotella sp.]MBO4658657.1 M6 family metalloprotease domain-containing protein [Prevotella sp.]